MDEGRQSRAIAVRARQWLRRLWPIAADRARSQAARELYQTVVNQARTPIFYCDLGVPDTPEGRFEVVGLHVALVVRRLRFAGAPGMALGQELFDFMFADFDESLRHIGIGDLSVGREVKRLAGSFYARLKALDEAFATAPAGPLRAMLRTNAYHGGRPPSDRQLESLACYVIATDEALREQPDASLLAGRIAFAPPAEAVSKSSHNGAR